MQDQIAPPGFKYVTFFDPVLKVNLQRLVKLDIAEETSWRLNLETLEDLKALISIECKDVDIRKIETTGDLYQYDSSSELDPDGFNILIPSDTPLQGRWIRQQSSGGSNQQQYTLDFSEDDWIFDVEDWLLQRNHGINLGSQAPLITLYEVVEGRLRLLALYDLEVTSREIFLRANQKFAGKLEVSALSLPVSAS
jgi:hypothetical protein